VRIAKLFVGDPNNQKGFFNNVMARTRHLCEVHKDVDCYMVRLYFDFILRALKGNFSSVEKEDFTIVDGIRFKNIWLCISWYDFILTYRLHFKVINSKSKLKKYAPQFKDYSVLSVHGFEAIFLAASVKEKFKIPFVSTWHGSDINLIPFRNNTTKHEIKLLLDQADHNWFVSSKLKDVASTISDKGNKDVLYTPPERGFFRYDERRIIQLKKEYGITTKYVVGYAGNYIDIKNVLVLPLVFEEIQGIFKDQVSFVIVGNGKLESELLRLLEKKRIKNLYNLGKQLPHKIPGILNCFDVLLLPSLSEGMPRVSLEAQACGVHVVGSDRGGIPEAIGVVNSFTLDEKFVYNISKRITELLKDLSMRPSLPTKFNWEKAVDKEMELYRILVKSK
jgi:teichuronic acid biosynthesis glycosyltransferase TuaC